MIERAAVTAPELIGLIVWWIVVLAAPVILVRRWRRRRRSADRLRRPGPPPSAAATSETRASTASRFSVPRLSSQALELLCRFVDFQHRLELAASELKAMLSPLPAARWRIEPYPLTGERHNTLLILGETGIFVVSATYAPGHWDDVISISRLASKLQALLPGYNADPAGDLPALYVHGAQDLASQTSTATGSAPGWSGATQWSRGSCTSDRSSDSAAPISRASTSWPSRTG